MKDYDQLVRMLNSIMINFFDDEQEDDLKDNKQVNYMRDKLKKIMKKYIKVFEKKHNIYFDFAINDDYLGILSFGDIYFINASDLVYDIDNDLPKSLILDWINENLENKDNYINLHSYAKGLRHSHLN